MIKSLTIQSPYKKIIPWIVCIAFLGCTILGFIYLRHRSHTPADKTVKVVMVYKCPEVKFNGKYSATFNDTQELQINAAQRHGITPVQDLIDIEEHLYNKCLVTIEPCDIYDCMADHPYLTPNAADLLAEIGRRYQEIEGEKPLRLTSALRTETSVKGLRRRNINAVTNSCHLYGTTFDISYRYMSAAEKRSLAQVLYELQSGGYCYVKYEVKQPCFHITSRR